MRLATLTSLTLEGRQDLRPAVATGLGGVLFLVAAAAFRSGAAGAMSDSVAASLGIATSGCAAAVLMVRARVILLRAEHEAAPAAAANRRAKALRLRAGRLGGWQQTALGGLIAAASTWAGASALLHDTSWNGGTGQATAGGIALLVGSFALLVVERHLAALAPVVLPEAPVLACLIRVPIAVSALCGVGCLMLGAGIGLGRHAGPASAILCLPVAAEIVIRALATMFVPFPPPDEARMTVRSAIAGAIALRRPPPDAMRDLFGIDLSYSCALAFVRAALVPVTAVLALIGWALSGVEALHLDQRGVYERFGQPVVVFGPGLHLHLPWPIGRLRPVEFGVLHDVPVAFAAGGGPAATTSAPPAAEADPGPAEDRLWNGTRASESAYLVASLSRGRQSFESLDIGLRVVYRVGLSDAAALEAAFAVGDPQRLVQARTSRLLARYVAHHTLPDMLGSGRAGFARDIATSLQDGLDASRTGLQVMAIVVEAIHPPAGAAEAYHAVQAAEVNRHTTIAEQQAESAQAEIDARRDATNVANAAAANARDAVVDAEVGATAFAADRTADARSPASFILERRLDKLASGLAHRRLLIVDHRLGTAGVLLDLRSSGGGAMLLPPRSREP